MIKAFGAEGSEIGALKSTSYYVDPADRDRMIRVLQENGEVQDMEIQWRRADGTLFWGLLHARKIAVQGEPAIVGGIIDITERKRILEALKQSEETANTLINATADAAMLATIDGRVLAHNEQTARFFGMPPNALVGKNVFNYFSPATVARNREIGDQIRQSHRPITITESRNEQTYETTIYPIIGPGEETDRVAVFARDVTEERQMLAHVRAKQEELDNTNKVLQTLVDELRYKKQQAEETTQRLRRKSSELEEVVSMISHDLQGPLVSIREQAGLFRRQYSAQIDERGQQLSRRISANAAQVVRMAESLVEYARSPLLSDKLQEIELRPLVKKAWLQVRDSVGDRQASIKMPDESLSVIGSRLALERVMYNILQNSVKYVPSERSPKVEVTWEMADDAYVISVSDNGIGIPTEEQQRVFELFYRGQSAPSDGTGIGLAVVKKIIDEARGRVELHSTPGEGTTVRIILPSQPPTPA